MIPRIVCFRIGARRAALCALVLPLAACVPLVANDYRSQGSVGYGYNYGYNANYYSPMPYDNYIVGLTSRDVVYVNGGTYITVIEAGQPRQVFYGQGDLRRQVLDRHDQLHQIMDRNNGRLPDSRQMDNRGFDRQNDARDERGGRDGLNDGRTMPPPRNDVQRNDVPRNEAFRNDAPGGDRDQRNNMEQRSRPQPAMRQDSPNTPPQWQHQQRQQQQPQQPQYQPQQRQSPAGRGGAASSNNRDSDDNNGNRSRDNNDDNNRRGRR